MYIYELTDILFTIKSFKKCTNSFDTSQHLQFNESTTRSSNTKLCHKSYSNAITANNYFGRLAIQIMEYSTNHKFNPLYFLWNHFYRKFWYQ